MNSTERNSQLLGLILLGISPYFVNGLINSRIYSSPAMYWSFEFLCWVVAPLAVYLFASRYLGLTAKELGFHSRIFNRESMWLVVIVSVVYSPIDYALYKSLYGYFSAQFPSMPLFQYQSVVPDGMVDHALVALYFGLTAGLVEEAYFRGAFPIAVRHWKHPTVAYLVLSPTLFAAIHWEGGLANVLATFSFGMFSVVVYLAAGNLWPLIVGHAYTDFVWYK